jgi:hypothetical protein
MSQVKKKEVMADKTLVSSIKKQGMTFTRSTKEGDVT